jgi:hypothetical protein
MAAQIAGQRASLESGSPRWSAGRGKIDGLAEGKRVADRQPPCDAFADLHRFSDVVAVTAAPGILRTDHVVAIIRGVGADDVPRPSSLGDGAQASVVLRQPATRRP